MTLVELQCITKKLKSYYLILNPINSFLILNPILMHGRPKLLW